MKAVPTGVLPNAGILADPKLISDVYVAAFTLPPVIFGNANNVASLNLSNTVNVTIEPLV